MTIGVLSLLLNLLIVGLLMATISYCWLLNKRIKILQDSKGELANLLKYFDESTTRASETIVALQSASKKIGENIQARMDKVNYLMDDLSFMIEKGNRLADPASTARDNGRTTYQSTHQNSSNSFLPLRPAQDRPTAHRRVVTTAFYLNLL